MDRLQELASRLTAAELKEVEDFAEFLAVRKIPASRLSQTQVDKPSDRFGSWVACLAHVHPEMSDKEFKKLIADEWVRAGED